MRIVEPQSLRQSKQAERVIRSPPRLLNAQCRAPVRAPGQGQTSKIQCIGARRVEDGMISDSSFLSRYHSRISKQDKEPEAAQSRGRCILIGRNRWVPDKRAGWRPFGKGAGHLAPFPVQENYVYPLNQCHPVARFPSSRVRHSTMHVASVHLQSCIGRVADVQDAATGACWAASRNGSQHTNSCQYNVRRQSRRLEAVPSRSSSV